MSNKEAMANKNNVLAGNFLLADASKVKLSHLTSHHKNSKCSNILELLVTNVV